MSKNNLITADQAEPTASEPVHTVTPARSRSPRRMARPPAGEQPAEWHATSRSPSKISTVVALLERAEGATLAELVAATGWLPHTTRAALTGLRKKGHTIARTRRDDATCYKIESAA